MNAHRPSRRPISFQHRSHAAVLGAIVCASAFACSATSGVDPTGASSGASTSSGGQAGGHGGAGGHGEAGGAGGFGGSAGTGEGGLNLTTSGGGGDASLVDVNVVITADNAYSFGYGDVAGIVHFTQGQRAQTAGQIFNCGEGPEAYTIPAKDAPPTAYLYIITWDDLSVTQGVLGQFQRQGGNPLYTGDPKFEACATGINLSASQTGPTLADINAQIAVCNSGVGDPSTTSAGWVNSVGAVTAGAIGTLAIGEANDVAPGGSFPPTCPTGVAPAGVASIDPASHWMWYNPGGVANPFQSTGMNTFRAYLIFRLAAEDLPPPN